MGYAFVTQVFPALLISLARRNPVTWQGAMAGILVGVGAMVAMTARGLTMADVLPASAGRWQDLNVGIVALALSVAATAAVSAATQGIRARAAA